MTSQLHNKITTSRLTTTYPGTYENYIDSFCRLLSDYNNLVTFEKRFTEDMKIDLLHNALGDIPELALTRSQISISTHTSPVVLGFPYFVSLYKMNCAHLVDKAPKATKAPRQINNAITSSSEHEEDINDSHLDDLELQVYAARRHRSARLSSELWKSLSPDKQKAWDSLSMEHKAAILKFGSTIKSTSERKSTVKFADTSSNSDSTEGAHETHGDTPPLSINKTKVTPTTNTSDAKGTPLHL
jgi:hypothetical protein